MIKDFFGILIIASVNVINLAMLVNIYTMKTVSAGKKIVNKLVEECTANIFEVKIAEKTLTENTRECSSSTLYSSSTIFTIKIRTATFFVYYKYMNHNKKDCLKI